MNADIDLQVWLESSVVAQTSIIVPHVQSDIEQMLSYRLVTTQEGPSGRSSIGQSGEVQLKPDQATPLARLAIRRDANDQCHISLTVLETGGLERQYDFPCPEENTSKN